MSVSRIFTVVLALLSWPSFAGAQFTKPNIIDTAGDLTTVLGQTLFVNHGLVGVGRIPASTQPDPLLETFGSVSALQITDWVRNADGSYSGTFNILPDRGYNTTVNNNNFFADYAARIQRVSFTFTPFTGPGTIGGTTTPARIAAQNQIMLTSPIAGTKFQYFDPVRNALADTTGLDPDTSVMLFGNAMPYVSTFTGLRSPTDQVATTYKNINRLPLDSEALVINADGSGYVGDEYGAHVYYFNASKQIIGAIVPPPALRPHKPVGTLNFGSVSAPTNGRRNNQGFEGIAKSPDGSRLFVLLQSAAVQDTNSNAATRLHTRLLVYDLTTGPTPASPIAEYVVTLPTYKSNGDGGAVDSTCAQSEIIALDNHRILILSRDGNGLGNANPNPSMFKSFLLADLSVGTPTNFAADAAKNAEGGKITTSPGVLDPSLTAVTTAEVVNMLNRAQLDKFNIQLDKGTEQVNQLTLGEKWEGATIVSALDPAHPRDYFLFVGNDNDFLTSVGVMKGPDQTLISYDGFNGYLDKRQPAKAADGSINANDTMFLVYRITDVLDTTPPAISGLPSECTLWPPNHKMVTVGTVTAADALTGIAPGSFTVSATTGNPADDQDIEIAPDGAGGFVVRLRAERAGNQGGRTYSITATARDLVGNVAVQQARCVVPHDSGRDK